MNLDWLKHAFTVEKPEDFEPTEEQRAVAEKVCRWSVRRGLTTPTLLFLESSRGMNYIAANAMHFFRPAVAALLDTSEYHHFAQMLEHRGSIDYLCRLLEELDSRSHRRDAENAEGAERIE